MGRSAPGGYCCLTPGESYFAGAIRGGAPDRLIQAEERKAAIAKEKRELELAMMPESSPTVSENLLGLCACGMSFPLDEPMPGPWSVDAAGVWHCPSCNGHGDGDHAHQDVEVEGDRAMMLADVAQELRDHLRLKRVECDELRDRVRALEARLQFKK